MWYDQKSRSTVGQMKWTVAQSEWLLASHTLVITVGQAFTQHSNDVIQSQHAPAVPEDTRPAVLSKAMVNTHLNIHTPTRSSACSTCMHLLTQSHYCKYTPKHTHHPTHAQTHQQCVQNVWHRCLWAPLFSGKGLAFHKLPSVYLCKRPSCASVPGCRCLKAHFVT